MKQKTFRKFNLSFLYVLFVFSFKSIATKIGDYAQYKTDFLAFIASDNAWQIEVPYVSLEQVGNLQITGKYKKSIVYI